MTRDGRAWRIRRRVAPVWLASLLALASCSGGSHSAPIWTAGFTPPTKPFKIVVLRTGGATAFAEPPDSDIADGLKQEGFTSTAFYTLESREAGGDPSKLPALVDSAVKDGADVLIALTPEAARVAAERSERVPVCFGFAGSPFAAGLAKDRKEHKPNVTGAYIPFELSYTSKLAHASLPKAQKFGILVLPDDAQSVAHKDAMLLVNGGAVPVVTEEFRADSEAPAAAQKLIDQKVDAILLCCGIGPSAAKVIELARQAKIPVFGFSREQAEAGAAVCRVPNPRWSGFEAGRKAVAVLEGGKPADIDLREGTVVQTIVNEVARKEMNVQVPGGIMREATVIGGAAPAGGVRSAMGPPAGKKKAAPAKKAADE